MRAVILSCFAAILLATPATGTGTATDSAGEPRVIMALGDSLTAGYGLPRAESFPVRLEAALVAEGIPARVINAGVSGDTSRGGAGRLEWLLAAEAPDLLIVELGANDALRGLDPAETEANLRRIIRIAEARKIHVLLSGMRAPPNMGREYEAAFNAIYPRLAREFAVTFHPFFVEVVVGRPELNLADGIHPNAAGVAAITADILPVVRAALDAAGATASAESAD